MSFDLCVVICIVPLLNKQLHLLALLDYVSRAHEIEIRPSSVRRPSVASIISVVASPWAICPDENEKKIFF